MQSGEISLTRRSKEQLQSSVSQDLSLEQLISKEQLESEKLGRKMLHYKNRFEKLNKYHT